MKGVSDDDIARWIFEDSEVFILCNLKYIIKSLGEFIFMFFSFKTVG